MPKVWNKRDPNCPKDVIYVGRPHKWGNPFVVGRDGSREACIAKYKEFLMQMTEFEFKQLRKDLQGKDLACWCAPKPCHAEVLLDFANSDYPLGMCQIQFTEAERRLLGYIDAK